MFCESGTVAVAFGNLFCQYLVPYNHILPVSTSVPCLLIDVVSLSAFLCEKVPVTHSGCSLGGSFFR